MILTAAAVTTGLAATVGGLTVGLIAVLVRVLAIVDLALTGDDGSERVAAPAQKPGNPSRRRRPTATRPGGESSKLTWPRTSTPAADAPRDVSQPVVPSNGTRREARLQPATRTPPPRALSSRTRRAA